MKRREMANQELAQIVQLRRAGGSWVKIQRETGITRRTAKRAYDKWERSENMEALKGARKDVAVAMFHDHMNDVVRLGAHLVINLSLPHLPDLIKTNAQWQQDLLPPYIPSETGDALSQVNLYRTGDLQLDTRSNERLLQSLMVHTSGKVRWNALDQWKEASDNCITVRDKLQKEASELVKSHLQQERERNRLPNIKDIKEESGEDDPVKRMAEAVLRAIWQGILRDQLDQDSLFEIVSRGREPAQVILVKVRGQTVLQFTRRNTDNTSLGEGVKRTCQSTYKALYQGKLVGSLQHDLKKMKEIRDELEETLNPLTLRPIILGTRCDLCPA